MTSTTATKAAPSEPDIESRIAAGRQAVADALAAEPFRATPSWEDLHALTEALLRVIFNAPKPAVAAAEPAETETAHTGDDDNKKDQPAPKSGRTARGE